MFEQTFKNIDDVLWKEAGCNSELDYTEQTSWLLFLKYFDDLQQERAMAAGLPVVSTNVGGVPDVVQDQETGYLVSPDDARGLAQAIGSLDGNPDRRRALGEAGRKRALELFTRERLLSRIATLYESLLAPPLEMVQADR